MIRSTSQGQAHEVRPNRLANACDGDLSPYLNLVLPALE